MNDLDRVEREVYSEKKMKQINNDWAALIYQEAKKHNFWRQGWPGLVKDPCALHPVFRQYTPVRPPKYDQICAEHDMARIHEHYDAIQREYRQQLAEVDAMQAELADYIQQCDAMLAEIEVRLAA